MARKRITIAASRPVRDEVVESAEKNGISVADVQRRRAHPVLIAVFTVLALGAITVPYGAGRFLALEHTAEVSRALAPYDARSMVFLAWAVTTLTFMAFGMVFMDNRRVLWGFVALFLFSAQQFICGIALVKTGFWYGTRVVYGAYANYANSLNVGVFTSAAGLAVFVVVYLFILFTVKKTSSFNVLSRSWVSLISFSIIEVIVLFLAYLSGIAGIFIS